MFFKKERKIFNKRFGGWFFSIAIVLFFIINLSCNDIGFDEKFKTIVEKYGENALVIERFEFTHNDNQSTLNSNRVGYFADEHYIEVIVPFGTIITQLVPMISFSGGEINNYDPDVRSPYDFTHEVFFGTPANPNMYRISVIIAADGDHLDGTVAAGGFTFMKCTIGQRYRLLQNDCRGTGNAGSNYGASKKQFCDTNSNCGSSSLDGTGNSEVWNACANLTDFGDNWTVPTADELKQIISCDGSTLSGGYCGSSTSPSVISKMFPETPADVFWTKNYSASVETIRFNDGAQGSESNQTLIHYVRCKKQ